MALKLIVAVTNNGVIGVNNTLPWKLKDDMKNFKELTTNNVVVMGRKTYESIGKPLPSRINIVLTRDNNFKIDHHDVLICHDVDFVLDFAKTISDTSNKDVFIIGGAEIYKLFIDHINEAIITKIDRYIDGDAYFDISFISENFERKDKILFDSNDRNDYNFSINTYKKKFSENFKDSIIEKLVGRFEYDFTLKNISKLEKVVSDIYGDNLEIAFQASDSRSFYMKNPDSEKDFQYPMYKAYTERWEINKLVFYSDNGNIMISFSLLSGVILIINPYDNISIDKAGIDDYLLKARILEEKVKTAIMNFVSIDKLS